MRRCLISSAILSFVGMSLLAAAGCGQASKADNKLVTAAISSSAVGENAPQQDTRPIELAKADETAKEDNAAKQDNPKPAEGPDSGKDTLEAFAKAFSKEFKEKIEASQAGKDADFAPLVKQLTDRMATSDDPSVVGISAQVAGVLEMFSSAETVKPLYEAMNKFADRSALNNPKLASQIHELTKTGLARLNLVGTKPKIEGTTVDGTKFDLSKYAGKVVLLDFWATWCGPCIGELPNVKKVYTKYHDKGFEVVGISLDDDANTLSEFLKKEQIPWITLFPTGMDRGFDNPLAKEFMVEGIPATFLIDRSGKLASISARGERLAPQVEKLLEKK